MALLPIESVVSLLVIFVIFRIHDIISIAGPLVNGLKFILVPTDEELRMLNNPEKSRQKFRPEKTPEERIKNMYLNFAVVTTNVLKQAMFYAYYDYLATATLAAGITFCWSEMYSCVRGASHDFLSYMMVLTVFFMTLAFPMQLFSTYGSVEKQMTGVAAFFAFICAMFTIYSPPGLIDVNFDPAFIEADKRIQLLATALNLSVSKTVIFDARHILFVVIGLVSAGIAAVMFLPAMRFAKIYHTLSTDAPTQANIPFWKRSLLHLNVVLPLLVAATWINPLTSALILNPERTTCSPLEIHADCVLNQENQLMPDPSMVKESSWKAFRIYLTLFACFVKFICMRLHLQVFLMEPKDSILALLQQRGKLNTEAVKEKTKYHFTYLPVVVIQYIAPMIMCVGLALLLKTKSMTPMGLCTAAESTTSSIVESVGPSASWLKVANKPMLMATIKPPTFVLENGTAVNFNLLTSETALALLKGIQHHTIVPGILHEALLNYLLYWCHIVWFALSFFALLYWRLAPYAEVPSKLKDRSTPKSTKTKDKKSKAKSH